MKTQSTGSASSAGQTPAIPAVPEGQSASELSSQGHSSQGHNVKSVPGKSYFQECRSQGDGVLTAALKTIVHWVRSNGNPVKIESAVNHGAATVRSPEDYSCTSEHEHAILVFGAAGSGKSTLVNLLHGGDEDIARVHDGMDHHKQPAKPYSLKHKGHTARVFEMPDLSAEPDEQFQDLNRKCQAADRCLMALRLDDARIRPYHIKNIERLLDAVMPDFGKLQIVFTCGDRTVPAKIPEEFQDNPEQVVAFEQQHLENHKQALIEQINQVVTANFGPDRALPPEQFSVTAGSDTENLPNRRKDLGRLRDMTAEAGQNQEEYLTVAADEAREYLEKAFEDSRRAGLRYRGMRSDR